MKWALGGGAAARVRERVEGGDGLLDVVGWRGATEDVLASCELNKGSFKKWVTFPN